MTTYDPAGTYDAYKCVYVDARIRDIEPMAYAFLVNFAKDNQLTVAPWADRESHAGKSVDKLQRQIKSRPEAAFHDQR